MRDTAALRLEVVEHAGAAVVVLAGDLHIRSAPQLRALLDDLCGMAHPRVLVDLEAVQLLDSTGLGVLVGALKRSRLRDGPDIELICTSRQILRVLAISGLDRVFSVHDSAESALASVGRGEPNPAMPDDTDREPRGG